MLGADGKPVDRRTLTAASKARDYVNRCIRELEDWQGCRPTKVRISASRFLVLTEVGWINSWPGIEVVSA